MSVRALAMVVAVGVAAGCRAPGRPAAAEPVPDQVLDFATLFQTNCAGCHGAEGRGGASLALADPVYLAIADDAVLTRVIRNGITGSLMPAFARSAGGLLTDAQVSSLVGGMGARWRRPDALHGAVPPPYATSVGGDAARGAEVFRISCSGCHGAGGRGGPKASGVVAPEFLGLISDQGLRTTVIVGRPELGAPDWRGNVPGHPMSDAEVSDVVAWLVAQRPAHSSLTQGPR